MDLEGAALALGWSQFVAGLAQVRPPASAATRRDALDS